MTYILLDTGHQKKLEKFGDFAIVRPCSQALWAPALPSSEWERADAHFTREEKNQWRFKRKFPESWVVEIEGVKFKLSSTDFGHLGVFPEHSQLWTWARTKVREANRPVNVLNLFAYSGGATSALAQGGAKVCHLDASKGMVAWARENAALNGLKEAPIRWIVEDVIKFLKREIKRGSRYDGIILDPPSFGRGNQGEIFKIEGDIIPLLQLCRQLLVEKPLFLILSSHTPGMTPIVMESLLKQIMPKGTIESGEMVISSPTGFSLPCGSFGRWYV